MKTIGANAVSIERQFPKLDVAGSIPVSLFSPNHSVEFAASDEDVTVSLS
jgi:hypothetical protein